MKAWNWSLFGTCRPKLAFTRVAGRRRPFPPSFMLGRTRSIPRSKLEELSDWEGPPLPCSRPVPPWTWLQTARRQGVSPKLYLRRPVSFPITTCRNNPAFHQTVVRVSELTVHTVAFVIRGIRAEYWESVWLYLLVPVTFWVCFKGTSSCRSGSLFSEHCHQPQPYWRKKLIHKDSCLLYTRAKRQQIKISTFQLEGQAEAEAVISHLHSFWSSTPLPLSAETRGRGSHVLNHTSHVTSHSLFWTGAAVWHETSVMQAGPGFNGGASLKDEKFLIRLAERRLWWQERSDVSTVRNKVSILNLNREYCRLLFVCVPLDSNANSYQPEQDRNGNPPCRMCVSPKERSKDPLWAFLRSSGNQCKHQQRLAHLSSVKTLTSTASSTVSENKEFFGGVFLTLEK